VIIRKITAIYWKNFKTRVSKSVGKMERL